MKLENIYGDGRIQVLLGKYNQLATLKGKVWAIQFSSNFSGGSVGDTPYMWANGFGIAYALSISLLGDPNKKLLAWSPDDYWTTDEAHFMGATVDQIFHASLENTPLPKEVMLRIITDDIAVWDVHFEDLKMVDAELPKPPDIHGILKPYV